MEDPKARQRPKLYAVKYKIGEAVFFKHIYEVDVASAKQLIIKGIIEVSQKTQSEKIYEILEVVELKEAS